MILHTGARQFPSYFNFYAFNTNGPNQCQLINKTENNIDLLVTSRIEDSGVKYLFGYYTSIVEYLMCSLKSKLNIKIFKSGYRKNGTIIFENSLKLGDESYYNDYVVYQDYAVDVMTTLKMSKDKTLFNFIYFFQLQVWIYLILSIIILSILLNYFVGKRNWIIAIIIELISPLIFKPMNIIHYVFKSNQIIGSIYKENSFVLIISLWLLSSTIISLSFSGLILGSYFRQRIRPVVKSIEDIINNEEIKITGISVINHLKNIIPEKHKLLIKRYNKTNGKEFDKLNTLEIFDKISNGDLLAFVPERGIKLYQNVLPYKIFVDIQEKFIPKSFSMSIPKNLKHNKEICTILQNAIQMGLFIHTKKLENLYIELKGKLEYYNNYHKHASKPSFKCENIIQLEDLNRGIHLLLFFGYLIAILVFLYNKIQFIFLVMH